MIDKIRKLALIFLIVGSAALVRFTVFAQNVSSTPATVDSSTQAEQAALQQQLQEIETQIAQYEQELQGIQGDKNTLQNKIKQLKKQQATLNLKIKATTLQIKQLTGQITVTQTSIDQNTVKIGSLKQYIGQSLQLIYEQDNDHDSMPWSQERYEFVVWHTGR